MKVLIYDLLCTEVWKAKLYPLLKNQLKEINSVRSYMTVSISENSGNSKQIINFLKLMD